MDIDHAASVSQAVGIVAAYVGQHHVPPHELPALIASVHQAVSALGKPPAAAEPKFDQPTKREIDSSVGRDGIVSFIDGRSYKTLKRHLTAHGLTPDTYRARYGLPPAYPMCAAAYSEQRSSLAKAIGLGQRGPALHAVA